jgi:Zn-dependent peptidase ImmA (M78 family)
MPRSPEALVTPELLTWARQSAGYELADAARKLHVRLEAWEGGEARPTMVQLRKLGKLYRRPIAVFFLPDSPRGPRQPLRDFRRLPGEELGVLSPELMLSYRDASERRQAALELLELLDEAPGPFSAKADLGQNPESLGEHIRELLGVTYDQQKKWYGPYEPFNWWRSAIEELGVLAFQMSDVATSEVRGFSISDSPLPAVVVNRNDAPPARVFTLLHELTHVMLRAGGVCDLDRRSGRRPEEQRTEVFCNYTAGAALMPRSQFLEEPLVLMNKDTVEWDDEYIRRLATAYGTSREAVVRRLLTLGCTEAWFYEKKREQYREERRQRRERARLLARQAAREYRRNVAQDAISRTGKPFARIVLEAYHGGAISAVDATDYLSVKLKHLDRIEGLVAQRRVLR